MLRENCRAMGCTECRAAAAREAAPAVVGAGVALPQEVVLQLAAPMAAGMPGEEVVVAGRAGRPVVAVLLAEVEPRPRAGQQREVALPAVEVAAVEAEQQEAVAPQGPRHPPAVAAWAAVQAGSRIRRGRRT